MKKIEKLSPEQIARFPEFVKRWTDIGLCTDPADRPRAEEAIRKCYEIAGLSHPERIVWCGSPLTAGLTRSIVLGLKNSEVKTGASVGDSVRASVWASVRASVGTSVWASVGTSVWASVRASVGDSVRASVGDSVRASVGDSVWASVGDSVGTSVWASVGTSVWASVGDSVRASVWASVGASVWASVGDSVWASVGDSVGDSGYGQHDANWLAYYEYFRDACGLSEETQRLTGLLDLAQSANWWLPHEKVCWVCERHNVLHRDEGGRLHCENGPALSYPDGFSIWAWHGLRVNQSIIEHPELITVQQIEDESNAELRRVLIERYGQERYLLDAGAVKVASDEWGTLYRKDIPGDEPLVMVKVVNSTAEPDGSFKDYFLRVPPECAGGKRLSGSVQGDEGRKWKGTPHDAIAWTNHKTADTYHPLIET